MRPNFARPLQAVGLLILAGLALPAQAQTSKMADDLADQARSYSNSLALKRVIVQFRRSAQRGFHTWSAPRMAMAVGGRDAQPLPLLNGVVLRVPYRQLRRLAALPEVAWISPDRQLAAQWDYDAEAVGAEAVWNRAVNARAGSGVRVAILDTGVAPSADWRNYRDLGSRLVGFKDFVGG